MDTLIVEIHRKFTEEQFEFSKHAVDQSILRQIRVQEVREAIANGQVIEDYPQDKYGSSCLIYGMTTSLKGDLAAMTTNWQEALVEKQVTYTLNLNGQIILIENVPARVNEETSEQFFSPSNVERLQQTILDNKEPDHFIQVPVYKYSKNAA